MDRTGANPERVIQQMRERLRTNAVAIQVPIGVGSDFEGVVDLVENRAIYFDGDQGEGVRYADVPDHLKGFVSAARAEMIQQLALLDDRIMSAWMNEEEPDVEIVRNVVRSATLARQLTPVLMGSAVKNKGVQAVLDAVIEYLPAPNDREIYANDHGEKSDQTALVRLEPDSDRSVVAMAFKTVLLKFGQLTFMRVYQGTIQKGENLLNVRTGKKVRFGRLARIHADARHEIEAATAGDIIGVVGIDCASGDTFTSDRLQVALEGIYVPKPVVQVSIAAVDRNKADALGRALERFRREDPTFRVSTDPRTGETLIAGMGQLHLEVYVERIAEEFECLCTIGKPQVAYKERPSCSVEFAHRFKKMTGGPGQFAEIEGRMEPIPVDDYVSIDFFNSPLQFESTVVGGRVEDRYIAAAKKGFADGLGKGYLGGFESFGVRVVLENGSQHKNDSSDIAFRKCAQQALRDVILPKSRVRLWEPIMRVEVEAPADFQGVIAAHLVKLRGMVIGSEVEDGTIVIVAEVPLAEMFGYSDAIRTMTQGNGSFSMEISTYRETPQNIEERVLAELAK